MPSGVAGAHLQQSGPPPVEEDREEGGCLVPGKLARTLMGLIVDLQALRCFSPCLPLQTSRSVG